MYRFEQRRIGHQWYLTSDAQTRERLRTLEKAGMNYSGGLGHLTERLLLYRQMELPNSL